MKKRTRSFTSGDVLGVLCLAVVFMSCGYLLAISSTVAISVAVPKTVETNAIDAMTTVKSTHTAVDQSHSTDGSSFSPSGYKPTLSQGLDDTFSKVSRSLADFEATLKSCLGRYCMDEVYAFEKRPKVERYAMLAPSLPDYLTKMFEHAKLAIREDNEIYLSTNVPVYGYGRSHGWTRIIRFVDNIVVRAYLDVSRATNGTNDESPQFVRNYKAQLRAMMRWHCRLNHVSAHTSMITVHGEQLAFQPVLTIQSVVSFLNFKDSRRIVDQLMATPQDLLLFKQKGRLSIHDHVPPHLWSVAAEVIDDEMVKSKGLSKWPCLPFRDLKDDLIVQDFRHLSPNCSAAMKAQIPHVKCVISHDLAEQ